MEATTSEENLCLSEEKAKTLSSTTPSKEPRKQRNPERQLLTSDDTVIPKINKKEKCVPEAPN
jgi:hypothetical protein